MDKAGLSKKIREMEREIRKLRKLLKLNEGDLLLAVNRKKLGLR